MNTSCRFCGGEITTRPEDHKVGGLAAWDYGYLAFCRKCGRSSGFTIEHQTALRSMTVNLDEGMGRGLAADLLQTLRQAKKVLPETPDTLECRINITLRITDLEEYFEAERPIPQFNPGDMVYLRPIHGGPVSSKAHRIEFIQWSNEEWIAWLKGIRGATRLSALIPARDVHHE